MADKGGPADPDSGGGTLAGDVDPVAAPDGPRFDLLDADDPVAEHHGGIAWSETDWADERHGPATDHFDAFNTETWNFKPAPPPWHQSPRARLAIVAVVLAAVAMVVSIVLLAFGGSSDDNDQAPAPQTSATPTTTATTAPSSSVLPPPPPPPPPPPTEAAPQEPVYQRPRQQPSQTKKPEIGVTRTPVTRSQISASPQRPSGRN